MSTAAESIDMRPVATRGTRGRPRGSKNKPKQVEQVATSKQLPAHQPSPPSDVVDEPDVSALKAATTTDTERTSTDTELVQPSAPKTTPTATTETVAAEFEGPHMLRIDAFQKDKNNDGKGVQYFNKKSKVYTQTFTANFVPVIYDEQEQCYKDNYVSDKEDAFHFQEYDFTKFNTTIKGKAKVFKNKNGFSTSITLSDSAPLNKFVQTTFTKVFKSAGRAFLAEIVEVNNGLVESGALNDVPPQLLLKPEISAGTGKWLGKDQLNVGITADTVYWDQITGISAEVDWNDFTSDYYDVTATLIPVGIKLRLQNGRINTNEVHEEIHFDKVPIVFPTFAISAIELKSVNARSKVSSPATPNPFGRKIRKPSTPSLSPEVSPSTIAVKEEMPHTKKRKSLSW
jgi:hypothetical protein